MKIAIFIVCLFLTSSLFAQQQCTLEQLIAYALEYSPEALKIKTTKENSFWQWNAYRAELKPKLMLNSTFPAYMKQSIAVRQEDGSIAYRNIHQSQFSAGISLEQNLFPTGGKIFLSSDMTRFDDLSQKTKSYNGFPIYIGFEQELFAFNNFKWTKQIEPLKLEESQKEYLEDVIKLSYSTAQLFFELIIAQVENQISLQNKKNADTIFSIAKEKYRLGKISKNELLQLEFGIISAQKHMAISSLSSQNALLALTSFTGFNPDGEIKLQIPENIPYTNIDDSLALRNAFENSQHSLEFKRKLLESQRDTEKARKEKSLKVLILVNYGKSNTSDNFSSMYRNPTEMQSLQIGVSIPLFDWGRAKAQYKIAEANRKLVSYTIEQEKLNFRQEVLSQIHNYNMLFDFIKFTKQADSIASQRYEIARLRYIAGNISLTDYNIALEEKDISKKEYLQALKEFWLTYFTIKFLTLLDI